MSIVGSVLSLIWLGGLGLIVWLNLDIALEMKLNEWGDFLAGGFAPLGFLWLVIGYFQQGKELKLSRESLVLQTQELSNSVAQQKELVQATYEDIAFEKAKADDFRAQETKRAQPLFKMVESNVVDYGEGDVRLWFDVVNYGSDIKHVVVEVCSDCAGRSVEDIYDYSWSKWERDKKNTFWVLYESKFIPDLEWVAFNVMYIDGIGVDRVVRTVFALQKGSAIGLGMVVAEIS
jgi:hypothetical protein